MTQWTIQPLTWDGSPNGLAVQVTAATRDDAEAAYFEHDDAVDGPVKSTPSHECDDIKPCGCRASGLTRARALQTERGTIYASVDVARGSYVDRAGTVRCVGCKAPE